MKRIIYDIGANNGDDIPYYLMKCDKVVSVEANPELTNLIRGRFNDEINQGRLIVENVVVTDRDNMGEVDFYTSVHPHLQILGQFPMPSPDMMNGFIKIKVQSKSITSIVKEHGDPYYIKLDVNNNYEVDLLKTLFNSHIRPKFISSESHTMDVFLTLIREGYYNSFKLIDGNTVSEIYKDVLIDVYGKDTKEKYSFPHHSAGPFADDINGDWMNVDDFFKLLVYEGVSPILWKDIHATTL